MSRQPLTLLLFFLLVLSLPAQAQESVRRYNLSLRGIPLDEALRHLTQEAQIDLAYNPDLTSRRRAYCVIEEASIEEALRCLLYGTGIDYYRLSSGTYVLTEAAEGPALYGQITGLVVDRDTGEPLSNAHVLLADGAVGSVTNERGRFSFAKLKPGLYRLTTTYVGYINRVDTLEVPPSGSVLQKVELVSHPLLIQPVVIDGLQWRLPSEDLGQEALSGSTLLALPQWATPDVARSLNALVGVRFNDATAEVHVQGGEAGEHQFRLDGAPVFVPTHLANMIGLFSPFAIGRVTVHKAGFDVRQGSQISGVIDVEHALGGTAPSTLDMQVDPLSLNARWGLNWNQAGKTQGTFMAAARVGLWDLFRPSSMETLLQDWNRLDPFMLAAFDPPTSLLKTGPGDPFARLVDFQGATEQPDLGFVDLHMASRVHFGLLHSINASGYWGRRVLDGNGRAGLLSTVRPDAPGQDAFYRDGYTWYNAVGQIQYETVLNARSLASIRVRGSVYRLKHDFDTNASSSDALQRADDGNTIQEYGAEMRLDHALDDLTTLEIGLEPIYTKSRFAVQSTRERPIYHASGGWRVASFLSSRLTLSPTASVDLGARFTYLATKRTVYVEPRLSVRYDQPKSLIGPWSVRGALGMYRQYVNQFDVSNRGPRALLSTNRVWLSVDSSVTPPFAMHASVEVLLRPSEAWLMRLEVYDKYLPQLLVVNYTAEPPQTQALQPAASYPQNAFLADGVGYAYGAGVLVERRLRHARLEARYEYSHAERGVDRDADPGVRRLHGNYFPVPWDEPHRIELALDYLPHPRITVLGRWRGIWGRTWAFRQAYYDYFTVYQPDESIVPASIRSHVIDHINTYRLLKPIEHHLPPLYQLDLSAAYARRFGSLLLQARLDLLNVLNAGNVAEWRFVADEAYYDEHQLLRKENRPLLPFTPSLAFRLQW